MCWDKASQLTAVELARPPFDHIASKVATPVPHACAPPLALLPVAQATEQSLILKLERCSKLHIHIYTLFATI